MDIGLVLGCGRMSRMVDADWTRRRGEEKDEEEEAGPGLVRLVAIGW